MTRDVFLARSTAVVGAGPELPAAATPKGWAGQPGTRAPHVWEEGASGTRSTLDLFGEAYVLMSANPAWIELARRLQVASVLVGQDFVFPDDQPFAAVFGIKDACATLIRPDGVIAWGSDAQPDAVAQDAIDQLIAGMA